MTSTTTLKTALVTGGSSGLGRALVRALTDLGWRVITDARDAERLAAEVGATGADLVAGDLAEPGHRAALVDAVGQGGLDLLVNNASSLGPVPLRPLSDLAATELAEIFAVNAVAPTDLTTRLLPALKQRDGVVVSISSDAAVEHYETWGGYAASKAALDSLTLTVAAESGIRAYAVDPGDMRTPMHQDAFWGEDISDRPLPETVVPHLLTLITERPEPGRYRATQLAVLEEAR